jgi:hypothetical protein
MCIFKVYSSPSKSWISPKSEVKLLTIHMWQTNGIAIAKALERTNTPSFVSTHTIGLQVPKNLQQLELQPLNLKAWHMNLKWY